MHSLGNGTERFEKSVHDACRVELTSGDCSHGLSVDSLDVFDRVNEGIKSDGIRIAHDTSGSGRQPIHDDACFTVTNERCTSSNTHGRATRQQNLLQCQGTVVIVSQVRAGPRSSSGLEQLLASVAAVVDLDVARKRFGQVLK